MDRQFPPEIVQLIVKASLDRHDPTDPSGRHALGRYPILLKYSLINSTWRCASEPSLYEWVIVHSEAYALSFLQTVQSRGGTIEGVKNISILAVCFTGTSSSTVARLLKSVPRVVHVTLMYGEVDCGDLARLRDLRRLSMFAVRINGSAAPPTPCFPALRQMFVGHQSTITQSARLFFTPQTLPQLRHLDIGDLTVTPTLVPLFPQLQSINVGPEHYRLLPAATSLRLITVPFSSSERSKMFSRLSSLPFPPFIWIDCLWAFPTTQLAETLGDLLASTNKGLRVIILRDRGIDDTIESLIQQLGTRGIRVERQEEDVDGPIEAMERILAEEQQAEEEKSNAAAA